MAKGVSVSAAPRSWCGPDEPWSPEAAELQEFLARSRADSKAFFAPASAPAHENDEGELIALLHAVSPTFACTRATKSFDLDVTTTPAAPFEQGTSSPTLGSSPISGFQPRMAVLEVDESPSVANAASTVSQFFCRCRRPTKSTRNFPGNRFARAWTRAAASSAAALFLLSLLYCSLLFCDAANRRDWTMGCGRNTDKSTRFENILSLLEGICACLTKAARTAGDTGQT